MKPRSTSGMKLRSTSGVLLPLLVSTVAVALMAEPVLGQVSADRFAGMPARSIGPTGAIGRISAIDAVESDPNVVYVGAATGGLWKSVNGGQTWRAVFDDQPVLAIGAVVVNQTNPDVVWVGIGEGGGNNNNNDGDDQDPTVANVYRSLDGGETWVARGLAGLEGVHRILLHPGDPEIAYVGGLGRTWQAGGDRGVYKTTDGGQTWTRVLFVDEVTGVSDLVMDPSDPNRLLAAMWSSRRFPWSLEPRGPGSGLYLTQDGGDSWIRLEEGDGVPGGELGRITLEVFRGDPRVVYALVDSGEGVLLRSLNRGRTWRTVRRGPDLVAPVGDPSGIVADPVNESRLFHLSSRLSVSDDGGETFRPTGRGSELGYRVLWIHPEDPRLMYGGTDRGLYVSRDGGEHWSTMGGLPVGRFTHASVDMEVPFNVYGGLERNGSWMGPAYGWEEGGVRNRDWTELGSDDGFRILADPSEASHGYAVTQGGGLVRFNLQTGERKHIRPWAPAFTGLRLNQDVPIALDPHDPAAIFYGSQFVHKSLNRGETWQIISGDLTANDPAERREVSRDERDNTGLTDAGNTDGPEEEGGATITVIAPSPLDRDVIWVGTDEGDVHVTLSAGGEWESVRSRIRRVPDSSWVAHIEPSAVRPGSALVAFDAHRTGNRESLIFSTDNYGRDWERIGGESNLEGIVHTVLQDAIVEELLFAGTDQGMYVSLNRGEDWFKWTHGLPPVAVRDLVQHPRDHDLVIATYGRGAYVLDDIRPLRELARDLRILDVELFLFPPPPAFIRSTQVRDRDGGPEVDVTPRGQERPAGVLLTYWLGRNGNDGDDGGDTGDDAQDPVGDAGEGQRGVTVELLDFDGQVVRTFQGPGAPGMNRVVWDLREDAPTPSGPLGLFSDVAIGTDDDWVRSAEVVPGLFTVRISREGTRALRGLEVHEDPRVHVELVDRINKYQAVKRGVDLDARLRALRAAIASVHDELQRVIDLVRERGFAGDVALLEAGQALGDELRELSDFRSVMRYRSGVLGLTTSYDKPTEGQRLDLIRMEEELDVLTQRIGDFFILDINLFARRVGTSGLEVSFFVGPIG